MQLRSIRAFADQDQGQLTAGCAAPCDQDWRESGVQLWFK